MAVFDLSKFSTVTDFTPTNIISEVMRIEGGYVNHSSDRGGETNFGITIATAKNCRDLWSKYGWDGNMRTLPKALAYDIYYREFWMKAKCDILMRYHPLLAFHFFDFAVNSGTGVPGKHLQRILNGANRRQRDYKDIIVDGAIGNQTFDALDKYIVRNGSQGLKNLLLTMVAMQASFYLSITENREANEDFLNGWMTRASSKMREFSRLLN